MEPRPDAWGPHQRSWKQGYAQALVDVGVKPEQTAQWLAGKAWEQESGAETVGQWAEQVESVKRYEAERDAYGRRMERLGNPDE
jgi:hypothetical protein